MNRRDILKLFGAGAAIVPIVGGAPELAAEARLIEEPKLHIPRVAVSAQSTFTYNGRALGAAPYEIFVQVAANDGPRWEFFADQCVFKRSCATVDVTTRDSQLREFMPVYESLSFELRGRCVPGQPGLAALLRVIE